MSMTPYSSRAISSSRRLSFFTGGLVGRLIRSSRPKAAITLRETQTTTSSEYGDGVIEISSKEVLRIAQCPSNGADDALLVWFLDRLTGPLDRDTRQRLALVRYCNKSMRDTEAPFISVDVGLGVDQPECTLARQSP